MWLVLCDYPVRDRIQLFISTGQCGGVSWKDVVLKFKTEIYKYICGKKKKNPENQETDPKMQYNLHEKEILCTIQWVVLRQLSIWEK